MMTSSPAIPMPASSRGRCGSRWLASASDGGRRTTVPAAQTSRRGAGSNGVARACTSPTITRIERRRSRPRTHGVDQRPSDGRDAEPADQEQHQSAVRSSATAISDMSQVARHHRRVALAPAARSVDDGADAPCASSEDHQPDQVGEHEPQVHALAPSRGNPRGSCGRGDVAFHAQLTGGGCTFGAPAASIR